MYIHKPDFDDKLVYLALLFVGMVIKDALSSLANALGIDIAQWIKNRFVKGPAKT